MQLFNSPISLSIKFNLFVGAMILLSAAVGAISIYPHFHQQLLHEELEELEHGAQMMADTATAQVARMRDDLRMLRMVPTMERLATLLAADVDGNDPRMIRDSRRMTALFARLAKLRPEYLDITLVDPRGRERLRVTREGHFDPIAPESRLGQPHFFESLRLEEDGFYLSRLTGDADGRPVIFAALPLYPPEAPAGADRPAAPSGDDLEAPLAEPVAVLALQLDGHALFNAMLDGLSPRHRLHLYDVGGNALFDSGEPNFFLGDRLRDELHLRRHLPTLAEWMRDEDRALNEETSRLGTGMVEHDSANGELAAGLVSRQLHPARADTRLSVILTSPYDQALEPVTEGQRISLIAMAMTVPPILLLGWFASRRITLRLRRMAESVTAMGVGKTGHPLPTEAADEIGVLARAFTSMHRQLSLRSERKAEQRALTLLKATGAGVIGFDRNGRVTFLNPAASERLGFNQDDLLGRNIHQLVHHSHPDGTPYPEERCRMSAAMREGRTITVLDEVLWRKDGSHFPAEYTSTPLRDGDAEIHGCVVSFTDVTEQRATERALREARGEAERTADEEHTLGQILRLSLQESDMEAYLAAVLSLLLGEVGWLHLLPRGGVFLNADEGRGQRLELRARINFDPDLERECASVPFGHCLCGRAAESAQTQFAECIDERHDVRLDTMEPHGHYNVPILHEGRVLGVMVLYVPHGHPHEAGEQEFLERIAGVLSMGILRRYDRRALADARDDAQQADHAKSNFLANMSHEIRTPMNGVIGMLQLLEATELNPSQQHYLGTARNSAHLQLNLINDILDFSKIEAGKLTLESIEFDLVETVDEVNGILAERAHDNAVELAAFIDPRLPRWMVGDPTRLRQILTNLIGNAIKFTEQGEVVVRVTPDDRSGGDSGGDSGADSGDGGALRFQISDTGIGIPEERHAQLFNPFSQADESTTRRFGGSGLGLVICKELVGAMGGEIGFDSREGHGSSFWFTLPLAAAERHQPPAPVEFAAQRFLVVDDNDTNREIFEKYLAAWNVEHDSAADGDEALQRLRAATAEGNPFDVILLDMHMPEMDGLGLARAVSGERAIVTPRMLLLTSGLQPDDDALTAAGVGLALAKPVSPARLLDGLATLEKRLERQRADADDRPAEPPSSAPPPPSAAPTPAPAPDDAAPSPKHEARAAPPPPASRRAAPATAHEQFTGTLLLVEDNAINQQVAKGMLTQLGLTVELAENGRIAVDRLESERFDLIFMDLQMPVMDGLTATREIRRREAESGRPHTPIVAMTANALRSDREACLEAGMEDHLPKPVQFPELKAQLHAHLGGSATPSSAPPPTPTSAPIPVAAELDAETLDNLRTGLSAIPGGYVSVLNAFLEETPSLLARMSSGLDSGDPAQVFPHAHSLKSQCATVGALELAQLCAGVEATTREGGMERVEERVDRAMDEYERVLHAIEAELARVAEE